MKRREYDIKIMVNGRQVHKVVIDPHYELKHGSSMSDELIVRLVQLLDCGTFPAHDQNGEFVYYITDNLKLDKKFYKLVWLLEDDELYIGIVNAFRRR